MSDDQVQALTERMMRIEARLETMPAAQDFARLEAKLDTKPSKAFVWQVSVSTMAALSVAVFSAFIGVGALT